MAFAMCASSISTTAFLGTKMSSKSPRRTQKVAKLLPKAKYGDESVYFDLDDVEQTVGAWDMYAVDSTKRYPDQQSEFFERAADALGRRETMFGFLALGGSGAVLVWGAKGSKDAVLPITKGPQTSGEAGPNGKL